MQALVTAPGNTAIVSRVPIPEPGPNEIRVKVHSVALNPVDPYYVAHPVDKPGRVVGSDIAGVVDAIGQGVTQWQVGDRVAGLLQGATSGNARPGGFAEYAILEEDLTIRIPSEITFDQAATLPLCHGSLTAAQALYRLKINAPFPSPFVFPPESTESPSILIYSAATSVGLYTLELARYLRTPSGNPYRIFATASQRHHEKLLALGAEKVFDYNDPEWPQRVKEASGGIDYALDCISEDETTARISQTFKEGGEGVRDDVTPLYAAAWKGLGKDIIYHNKLMPADPSWRAVAFFKWLSSDPKHLPIAPNPVRLMPGGLERIVPDAFTLIGAGKVVDRASKENCLGKEPWMRPISGEKLVYRI